MNGIDDEFLANRIKSMFRKHGFPLGASQFIAPNENFPNEVAALLYEGGGIPIVHTNTKESDVILTTCRLIVIQGNVKQAVLLDSLKGIAANSRSKERASNLSLLMADGQAFRVHLPKGPEYYAYYNVLQSLIKMKRQPV